MTESIARPVADPEAGILVYMWTIELAPHQYRNDEIRGFAESSCREFMKRNTGLDATWAEWTFREGYEYEPPSEGCAPVLVPDKWVYVCEAAGPEGLWKP